MQSFKLNVNTKLSLIDNYICSLTNYESEVWSLHPAKDIEKVLLDFCKNKTWCQKEYSFNDGIC